GARAGGSSAVEMEVGSAAAGDSIRGPGDTLRIAITYRATPRRGYYVYARDAYSFVEPEDARFWYPCVDAPRDKARFEGWFTVANGAFVASNGVLVSASPVVGRPLPKGSVPGVSAVTWHWRENHPIATYLICVTIAHYAVIEDSVDGLPLLYAMYPEDTTKAKFDYARVPEMVRFYSSLFGPYPFDKYGMATVEPFGYGGMGHQTLTTLNPRPFSAPPSR